MRKRLLFLLPLFLGACSESGDSPIITIEKLFVDIADSKEKNTNNEEVGGDINYADHTEDIPALKKGDMVKAFLSLDGNGAELKTFNIQNDDEVKAELLYDKNNVTTEGNLTDIEKGQLRFKDGVMKATVLINVVVDRVDEKGNARLAFYLSSKAECDGAQEEIDLKMKKE